MAKSSTRPMWLNTIILWCLHWGINPAPHYIGPAYVLSVLGRTSGIMRLTPVAVIQLDRVSYIVGGSNQHQWVHNLRASGWAILSKGWYRERVFAYEIAVPYRPSILRVYLERVKGAAASFSVTPADSPAAFQAVAATYPIFCLIRVPYP